ncbi:cadherin-15 isoform X2 [Hyperolius riggenbachi]|uniref:cadherin-15 isoform X2 n=1 Tax=Hyperolius riggenbachi TaxID=752182 RepID=UPI0035A2C0BC
MPEEDRSIQKKNRYKNINIQKIQVVSAASEEEPAHDVPLLYPWRQRYMASGGVHRYKRAWVIPTISVSENLKNIPSQVVQIKSDKQYLGSVIYSITGPGVDEEPKGIFNINKTTGIVYLNAVLDREKIERFKLRAFALDSDGVPLEDPTDLEIVVLDQNDNRPVFSQSLYKGYVLENSYPGTVVMRVMATDADDPNTDNAQLKYSIVQQESPELFSINQDTGEIRTVQVGLDRESVGSYNLTVQVADMLGDGLSSTARAVIDLGDLNDNAPEFTQSEFLLEVPEQSSGVDIGRVSVTDRDLRGSPNWLVRYSIISGDPQGAFSIRTDPQTNEGILSVAKPLDHETTAIHNLTLSVANEAELLASVPRTPRSKARLTVIVKNVNEAPVFLENPLMVRMRERSLPGSEVAVYTAIDPDTGLAQDIRYSLVSDPANWLVLDGQSGKILTTSTMDRKSPFLEGGWYTALIRATDNAVPPLSGTGTLLVEVMEVNDHAPVLQQHSAELCSSPHHGNGVLLSAMDEDLSPQAHPFHFQLDDSFGMWTLNWSISEVNDTHAMLELLTDMEPGLYPVPLLVSDSGDPPMAALHVLNVTVCWCDTIGVCSGTAASLFSSTAGISLSALIIIMSSIALLLVLALLLLLFRCTSSSAANKGLLCDSEDDVRDNIFNYNEQGGGEEDQDAYDMNRLRNPSMPVPPSPRLKPPIRRDAPYSQTLPRYPRRPTDRPSDIADFIRDGLRAADSDPSMPPYDTALIYDYEGEGSVAGTLSSIQSSGSDSDQEYDYLQEWGPRFRRLADLYGHE